MLEDAKLLDKDYEESGSRVIPSISVDGIPYATSLFWQPIQNTEDPVAEVSETASSILEGADLFCVKQGKAPQFGICSTQQGYKKGTLVGAVSVATALSGLSSFVAVFKVDNGWWYICVRNDIILSDGDMVFSNEEEAKSQFMSMLAVPDWGKKIAPEDWGLEGTEDINLAELIKKGMRVKLDKINALRGAKLFMVIGVSAIVGVWLLSVIINSIFLAPPKRPVVAPIKPKAVIKKEVQLPPEDIPWNKVYDASQSMSRCYENVAALSQIMPPGWSIGEVVCTSKDVSTQWTRDVGRILWIEEALKNSGMQFASKRIENDGKVIKVTVALKDINVGKNLPNMDAQQLKATLNDLFQAFNQPVALIDEVYTSNRKRTYKKVKFTFSSVNNPMVWRDLLTKFSGLEINMIKYNKQNEKWDYEGAIYAL